jgi:hypothetical protein
MVPSGWGRFGPANSGTKQAAAACQVPRQPVFNRAHVIMARMIKARGFGT